MYHSKLDKLLFWTSSLELVDYKSITVEFGDKERFDKEQIGVKEPFPMTNLLHKDKERLALRNNFRLTKKFLIPKFDCTSVILALV